MFREFLLREVKSNWLQLINITCNPCNPFPWTNLKALLMNLCVVVSELPFCIGTQVLAHMV